VVAVVRALPIGVFSSCATPATNEPSEASFSCCTSWLRISLSRLIASLSSRLRASDSVSAWFLTDSKICVKKNKSSMFPSSETKAKKALKRASYSTGAPQPV